MADEGAFGSPLLGADSNLETFAFGGAEHLRPVLRRRLDQRPAAPPERDPRKGHGAARSNPAADPVGEVRKPLSADGSHLIFGTDKKFESAASSGSVVDLRPQPGDSDATQLVSTTPDRGADHRRSRRARRLLRRQPGPDRQAGRRRRRRQHALRPLHARRQQPELDPGRRHAERRRLQRHDRRRQHGLLHDHATSSPATPTRAPTSTAPTSARPARRRSRGSRPAPAAPATPTPANRSSNWNVASGGPTTAASSSSPAAPAIARGRRHRLLHQPRDCSTAPATGRQNQPNLYVVKPGERRRTSSARSTRASASRRRSRPRTRSISTNFVTGLSNPEGMAVDQDDRRHLRRRDGQRRTDRPLRLDRRAAANSPKARAPGRTRSPTPASAGANREVAVDSSGRPLNGAIYAIHGSEPSPSTRASGAKLGELTGFGEACGVAVDQSTGEVYRRRLELRRRSGGSCRPAGRHRSAKPTTPKRASTPTGMSPCHVGADTAGHVFAASLARPARSSSYNVSEFAASPPTVAGTEVAGTEPRASRAIPATGDLYNDEGNKIVVYDSAGTRSRRSAPRPRSAAPRAASRSTARPRRRLRAQRRATSSSSGTKSIPYEPIDNPAVVHGVDQAAVHDYEDFQVSPGRPLRAVQLAGAADRLPEPRPLRDLPLRRRRRRTRLPVLRPDRRGRRLGRETVAPRPQPGRRRPGVLHDARVLHAAGHEREEGRLRVGSNGKDRR